MKRNEDGTTQSFSNGSERLDSHGGRRLTVPGVGLVEIVQHETTNDDGTIELTRTVVTLEPLSVEQRDKLEVWLGSEWTKRTN